MKRTLLGTILVVVASITTSVVNATPPEYWTQEEAEAQRICRINQTGTVREEMQESMHSYAHITEQMTHLEYALNTAIETGDTRRAAELLGYRARMEQMQSNHAAAIAKGHTEVSQRLTRCANAINRAVEAVEPVTYQNEL